MMADRRTSSRRNAQAGSEPEMELEDNAPPPRRTSRHSASHTAEIDYEEDGPSFTGRWLFATIGILLSWFCYDLVLWQSLGPGIDAYLEDSTIASWQHYAAAVIAAIGLAAIVSIFIAAFIASKFGNLLAGISLFAIGSLAMTAVHVLQPTANLNNNDSVQAAVAILQMSTMPALADLERQQQHIKNETEAAQKALETSQSQLVEKEEAFNSLQKSHQVSEAKHEKIVNALTESLTEAQKQGELLIALQAELNKAKADATTQQQQLEAAQQKIAQAETAQQKLQTTINSLHTDIKTSEEKIAALNKEISDAKREIQRQKDMSAMEKMGTSPDQPPPVPGVK
jgi:hypothetical protein